MATQPTVLTTFRKLAYPGENSNPFWEQWRGLMNQIDAELHLRQLMSNMIPDGGGTITFNSGSNLMTWTADFVVPLFHWGFSLNLVFGPDDSTRNANIQNGQALIVTVPSSLNANRDLNMTVVSQLTTTANNQWVLAWNNSGTLVVRQIGSF